MNCEKNTVACRDLASFAIRSVLLASGGFIATTAAAQDECTSAVTLQLNTPTAFSTLTATASTGIPLDAFCPNTSLLWTSASPDVWFKWTAPSDGLATFNTCTADTSAIDTSIALYVGSCTSLVQVGCNGDMLHNNPGGCNVTDAKVANFPVSGGVTYYIRVAGIDSEFGVSRGNGQITVTHSHISAWGDNSFNQCDLPAGITNPSKMSIGDSHALAINSTGAVVAWGSNSLGQATVPAGLTSPRDVAAGSNFSLAVRSNGTLVGWGSNTSGRATPPTTVLDATKVAAGVFHGLALRSNGAVVAWGAGMTNTGVGSAFGQAIVPSSANSGIAAIAAGNLHSLALTSQGAVIAWGAGTTDTGVTPRFGQAIVPTAAQSNVEKIAAGYYHSVALKRDGSVVCWGAGATNTGTLPHYGQSIVPAGLGVVSDIAAGRYHTVVLRANGTVTGWGLSTDYQTSIPSVTASASAVAAGGNVSFARFSPCAGGAPQTYYRDVDGDGFGTLVASVVSCTGAPAGYAPNALDCNDSLVTYVDADGDTYGAGSPAACGVASNSDCNDANAAVNPAASEICDATNTDENCNGVADDLDALVLDAGRSSFYVDGDNDTYTLATTARFCDQPASGYRTTVSSPLDCNDANAGVNPGRSEICDATNTDENCNGSADDLDATVLESSKSNFYRDQDNDTYTVANATRFCDIVTSFRAQASAQVDCNDTVAAINPGATEVCDALNTDENCNNLADNADAGAADAGKTNFFRDQDNDAYTVAAATRFCDLPAGFRAAVSTLIDCNDTNAAINPGATEVCDANNVDENCNSLADNADAGAADAGKTNFFADSDNDTYTLAPASRFCDLPAGYRVAVSALIDCNDTNAAINPGATEICDAANTDENCNNLADNADAGAADAGKTNFFRDQDNDAYTVAAATRFCDLPAGFRAAVSTLIDCNDTNAAINPGATEVCDALNTDENCNNLADNADAGAADAGKTNFFADSDADTYTVASATRFCDLPAGFRAAVSTLIDCNDTNAAINPGALELCATSTIDNNCDGIATDVDANAADKVDFFRDADGDGFTTAQTAKFCSGTVNAGWLATPSVQPDCNDASNAIYPGALELCATSTVDNNCDGVATDVDANAADKVDFFRDADGDGFTTAQTSKFCSGTLNAGWLATPSVQPDCNDASNAIYPGALELCATSTIDNNCDGIATDVDANAADKVDFFRDADGDGFTTAQTSKFCTGTVNAGWLATPSVQPDCNDASNAIYPGALELCATSTIDNNCDGVATDVDANAADKVDFFRDADGDGFTTAQTSKFCSGTVNAGWLATPSVQPDCNDASNAIYPGALELCATSTVDNNCDGVATDVDANAADKVDFFRDGDGDGFTSVQASKFCSGSVQSGWLEDPSNDADCDDSSNTVFPRADELCATSTIDNNCDGVATDVDGNAADKINFFRDVDLDGFTTSNRSRFCSGTINSGWLEIPSAQPDCNDLAADVYPGAPELCSTPTVDNNCDAVISDIDANAADKVDFFADSDNDGYTIAQTSKFCSGSVQSGWLETASVQADCDDASALTFPGAVELCSTATVDNNCDSVATDVDALAADKVDFFADSDNDGYTTAQTSKFCPGSVQSGWLETASVQADCNDAVTGINPGASEVCDAANVDENCNSVSDNDDAGALESSKSDFFADSDNDGYTVAIASRFCDIVAGHLAQSSGQVDCNDASNAVYPGAAELCADATIDNNCDSVATDVDANAADKVDFFRDGDGDGFTSVQASKFCSGSVQSGWLETASAQSDCDDASALTYPGAPELCSTATVDNNCDSVATDVDASAADKVDFFRDGDGDGFTSVQTSKFCSGSVQSGWLETASVQADCDDASALTFPGAVELCSTATVDNNCDSVATDVDANAADKVDFFADSDNDGYTVAQTSKFCPGTVQSGWLETASAQSDCNDSVNGINPGATEVCDAANVDENCNSVSDNDDAGALESSKSDFFADSDNDGYTVATASRFCDIVAGHLAQSSGQVDCNDASNAVYPGAAELCADATIDNNCDSVATDVDANASDKVNFFRDGDGDSYTIAQTSRFCSGTAQSGWSETASGQADCDDASASVHPGAVELCATSSVDNNCDGLSTDVDATAADKVDFFRDADLDAFTTVETSKFCSGGAPAGWAQTASAQVDCNDLDPVVNPAALEVCDLGDTDENCNGSSDNADMGAQDATRFDFFVDADGDGYGAGAASRWCDKPVGYAAVSGDDCPSDPLKRVPGTCGCGVVDVDANGNGVMDCVEVGVSMTPSLTVVRPGVQFDLVIGTAQVSVPVLGLQTSIAFDPTMLEVVDAVPSGPFDTLLALQVNNQIGRVSVAVGTFGDPVTTGGSMISIRFAVKQGSPTDCDARDRISFYTSGSVATRFSRADGRAFVPVLEPLAQLSIDGVAPSITSVPTGSAQADAGCSATVPSLVGSVVASDDCTGASGLVITQSPAAGSSLSAGSHQISFTVTDAAGNSSVLAGAFEVVGNNLDYYPDADGDGFGSSTAAAQASCSPVAGKVTDHTDCDDSSAAIHPGAAELCADSTVDNNCDGVSTDVDALAADKVAFYRDGDGDGYTSLETAQFCAGTSNAGYRSAPTNPLDCNDGDATIHPGAVENCANLGIDNDCDTIAISDEEAIDSIAYMLDSDADGFGAGPAQMSCTVVPGKVTNALDCNDGDPTINPNGVETCADMGIDNNCNGIANLDAEAIDCGSFCADLDGDGFGAGSVARACSQPSGHVPNGLDCDDTQYLYADTDGDGVGAGAPAACGVPSNTDGCPTDPAKTSPGTCGCGVADTDTDGDGTPNCTDGCPNDPAKTSPGTCGCGVADTDTDGDGRANCVDNCPSIANPDQLDCNSNGTGDVCEIAAGTAQDCNTNGRIDSCDIASGVSTDLDASGKPDDCEFVVGGSGYGSIQAAIDFAPNGSVVKVAPGTWAPFVVNKRGLTVQAIGTREVTIVDGGAANRVVEVIGRASIRFTLRGFTIRNGRAAEGAGMLIIDADPLVENCVFTGNVASGPGGAVRATNSAADFALVVFTGNSAASGGAIANSGAALDNGALHASSCQFRQNTAATDGGAIANSGRLFLLECTLEQNTAGSLGGGLRQLETGDTTVFTSRFCMNVPDNINGAFTGVGENILSGDCNANGLCDADEIASGSVGDCNTNGIPDSCDIAGGAADCNTNGIPDSCDIASGTSGDVDANGIPDECKPDCNNNDIPDAYEIATGATPDCNTNGIPDSCDIAANTALDCNANGQLDSCEIAAGTVRDCNSNGIVDSCEIATGAADADNDGRLDRCEIVRGDLNLDGVVDAVDLATILTRWGPVSGAVAADINRDGFVDAIDLSVVLGGWGVVPNF